MHLCECKKVHALLSRRIPQQKNVKPKIFEEKGHRFIEFHNKAVQMGCCHRPCQRPIQKVCIKSCSKDGRSCSAATSIYSTKSCCNAACQAVCETITLKSAPCSAINLPPCPIIEPPTPIHETNPTNPTYPIYHNTPETPEENYADKGKSHGKDVDISLQPNMPSSEKEAKNCCCSPLMVPCQRSGQEYKTRKKAEGESKESLLEIRKRNVEASKPIVTCKRPSANTRKAPHKSKLDFVDKVKEISKDKSKKEHLKCEAVKHKALYKCPFQGETQIAYFIPCIKRTDANDVETTVNAIYHWLITEHKKRESDATKKSSQGNCEAKRRKFEHKHHHEENGHHRSEKHHGHQRYHEQDRYNPQYDYQHDLTGSYYEYQGHEEHSRTHPMEHDPHQHRHHSARSRSMHKSRSRSETRRVVREPHHLSELHRGAKGHDHGHLKGGTEGNIVGHKEHHDLHNENYGSRHKREHSRSSRSRKTDTGGSPKKDLRLVGKNTHRNDDSSRSNGRGKRDKSNKELSVIYHGKKIKFQTVGIDPKTVGQVYEGPPKL